MAELLAIAGLVRKRAELAGQMKDLAKRRHGLSLDLAKIDRALLILGYGKDPKDIRPKRTVVPPLFKQAQLRRLLYDIRRDDPAMTDNQAIADEVMRHFSVIAVAGLALAAASHGDRETGASSINPKA